MRLDIVYRMSFRYASAVVESHNEIRMMPRESDRQSVLGYRLTCRPQARVLRAVDYWGTSVDCLSVGAPHRELELTAESCVDTALAPLPSEDVAVSALAHSEFRSEAFEFMTPSEHVQWSPGDEVQQRAEQAGSDASSVSDLIRAVLAEASSALTYRRGSTEIGVSLAELLESGEGVCQDFAHLSIGMLRSVGVPARYVSGYLFAADETVPADQDFGAASSRVSAALADVDADAASVAVDDAARVEAVSHSAADSADSTEGGSPRTVSVQTHAWVEAAVPGFGWWALDPTNGGGVGERHVVIGCGRDYGDVPPFRGAFTGTATAEVDAEVVIGRLPRADLGADTALFAGDALRSQGQ